MTVGVGGKTPEQALAGLAQMTEGMKPVGLDEYQSRIAKAQGLMREQGIAALYLNAGSNLYYFTGVKWSPSERMVGAVLPANGALAYIAPAFEEGTIRDFREVDGFIHGWQEHESPYRLLLDMLAAMGVAADAVVGLCPSLAFFMFDGIRRLGSDLKFVDASCVTNLCRYHKSATELALMQRAKDMTLEVQKAAASILRAGISTTEVAEFIREAHRKVGAPGSTFCIVLFGEASAFPPRRKARAGAQGRRHGADRHGLPAPRLSVGYHSQLRVRHPERPPARPVEPGKDRPAGRLQRRAPGRTLCGGGCRRAA